MRTLNVREVLALESLLGEVVNVSAVNNTFDRVLLHGTGMHTANYSAQIKRSDCFFTLHNHTGVYELFRCVNLTESNELLLVLRYFVTKQMRCCYSALSVNVMQNCSEDARKCMPFSSRQSRSCSQEVRVAKRTITNASHQESTAATWIDHHCCRPSCEQVTYHLVQVMQTD